MEQHLQFCLYYIKLSIQAYPRAIDTYACIQYTLISGDQSLCKRDAVKAIKTARAQAGKNQSEALRLEVIES